MGMQEMMEKAMQGMEGMPKCDKCGRHLAGGAFTFNDLHNEPKTWCMKCVLEAITFYEKHREERLGK